MTDDAASLLQRVMEHRFTQLEKSLERLAEKLDNLGRSCVGCTSRLAQGETSRADLVRRLELAERQIESMSAKLQTLWVRVAIAAGTAGGAGYAASTFFGA